MLTTTLLIYTYTLLWVRECVCVWLIWRPCLLFTIEKICDLNCDTECVLSSSAILEDLIKLCPGNKRLLRLLHILSPGRDLSVSLGSNWSQSVNMFCLLSSGSLITQLQSKLSPSRVFPPSSIIHFLYLLKPVQGHGGVWSIFQLSHRERQGSP